MAIGTMKLVRFMLLLPGPSGDAGSGGGVIGPKPPAVVGIVTVGREGRVGTEGELGGFVSVMAGGATSACCCSPDWLALSPPMGFLSVCVFPSSSLRVPFWLGWFIASMLFVVIFQERAASSPD